MYNTIEEHYRSNFGSSVSKLRGRYGIDAEDIVQEAYVRALTYHATFQYDGDFNRWFGRILANTILTYRHGQLGFVHEEEPDEEITWDGRPDPETLSSALNLYEVTREMMKTKTPQEYDILNDLIFHDRTVIETAKDNEVTPGKVWSVLRRFRRELTESGVMS